MTVRLLTTDEVAERFRTSPSTVRYWRHLGIGPAGIRVGRRVLGHASANTTLATYSRLWPDADDRTRTAAEHLMASALPNRAASSPPIDAAQDSELQNQMTR